MRDGDERLTRAGRGHAELIPEDQAAREGRCGQGVSGEGEKDRQAVCDEG